jgi:hypothetical protein
METLYRWKYNRDFNNFAINDADKIEAFKNLIGIIFYKGDCIFVPALSEKILIHGQAQFLDVRG